MNPSKKPSSTSRNDIKVPQDLLVSSNVANEINAFFASDPDNLGDNPLSPETMSHMYPVDESQLWSTRQTTENPYNLDAYLNELVKTSNPLNYTVLGLTGSGVASTFFTYYNVNEYMAVFAQLNYGNITQDYNEEIDEVEFDPAIIGLCACKMEFDDMINQIVKRGKWPKGKILVIQESHKDKIDRCGWLTRESNGKSTMEWITDSTEEDEMPQTAIAIAVSELSVLLLEEQEEILD